MPISLLSSRYGFAVGLALALLIASVCWRLPFMLWDHLDFAPIYAAWLHGTPLSQTIFWQVHGGHLHTLAYAVLLATTWLSHGQTWLDGVTSWVLLCLYAATVLSLARTTLHGDSRLTRAAAGLLVLFALYPGHLANLQWGWQVAVFLCLLGSVICIALLTAAELTWSRNALAWVAATLALASFATALALPPIAVLAIAMRRDLGIGRRLAMVLPWLLLPLLWWFMPGEATLATRSAMPSAASSVGAIADLGHYVLNYLGAGIARFATAAAAWLAALALLSAAAAVIARRAPRASWPWLGLLLFGILAALLTAIGRAGEGSDQAFVSRYVSFSSVFWCGWVGLIATAARGVAQRRAVAVAFVVVAAFAVVNAVAMARRAERLAAQARITASIVCASWPHVDRDILASMHYDGADAARERLAVLRSLGFAPFDACANAN